MLGAIQNGQLGYGNPQNEYPGSACWLYNPNVSNPWVTGSQYCESGVQSHFAWAAAEWLFKDCAIGAGFPRSYYTMTLSDGSIRTYDGECTEEGLLRFLEQVQSLYGDLVDGLSFQVGPTLYQSRAAIELNAFLSRTRAYGRCPCSWGNVGSQDVARTGRYWEGHSYSYFYNPAESIPYFKVE
jgi:hypothetical protein